MKINKVHSTYCGEDKPYPGELYLQHCIKCFIEFLFYSLVLPILILNDTKRTCDHIYYNSVTVRSITRTKQLARSACFKQSSHLVLYSKVVCSI